MPNKPIHKDISVNVGTGVKRGLPEEFYEYPSLQDIEKINNKIGIEEPSEDYVNNDPYDYIEINPELKPGEKVIHNNRGDIIYSNRPVIKNQIQKEGLYKIGHPIAKVFNLSNKDELEEFNKLLAGTGSQGEDPQYVNLNLSKQFWNGQFMILAIYSEVWYMKTFI